MCVYGAQNWTQKKGKKKLNMLQLFLTYCDSKYYSMNNLLYIYRYIFLLGGPQIYYMYIYISKF